MNERVLLVEDDFDLAASLVEYLELEDIACDYASNGAHGLQLAQDNNYDVLLLDVMLPKLDGFSLCEIIRREGSDVPVLMITAKDSLDDKAAGFEAGTDDYLVKPFALQELLYRVRALARRRSSRPKKFIFADVTMDTETKLADRDGTPLNLAPKEWLLLETLIKAAPAPVAREDLIRAVWGENSPESNSLKVHMHKLRQKVDKPFGTSLIQTVSGTGFALRQENA